MIAIIDYGVGNLRSVEKAINYVGGNAEITSDIDKIMKADGLVLPGVGAFGEAMKKINACGISEAVKKSVNLNKPFLGICLGMQMLFEFSEEGGENVEGLGLFKGNIRKLPGDNKLKIPHMGWNTIKYEKESNIFKGIENNSFFYFVHSYYLDCAEADLVAAKVEYGIEFDVAINRGNIYATQFHPEKSGENGLLLLKNFVSLCE